MPGRAAVATFAAMIHYSLRCAADHAFDGWFKDSAAFDAQAARGLVACPECGDTGVRRGLMAPALARKGRKAGPVVDEQGAPSPEPVSPPDAKAGAVMPDQVRAVLQKLRAEVERHCDDVGDSFAAEARRIHTGESPARGIYGNTTPDEAQALADDGIEVARLPWVPRAEG